MKDLFKKNSIQDLDFQLMSDLEWHCTKCELKSGQAKTWQVWRQEKGIQLEQDSNGNYFKRLKCKKCEQTTIHRKLKSLEILENTKIRYSITKQLTNKIKNLYNNEEAIFLRQLSENELEVDHKFPQIRWNKDEIDFSKFNNIELKNKFILLNRNNNLLKSRFCEKCFKNNIRGCFPGIEYWYKGNEKWNGKTKFDENGCIGCFWYDPYEWRSGLKKIINKKV